MKAQHLKDRAQFEAAHGHYGHAAALEVCFTVYYVCVYDIYFTAYMLRVAAFG